MQNLLWNMLQTWLHVTLLLQDLMHHILRQTALWDLSLSLTFWSPEDTWSRCGVTAKRNLLERANGPVATTKADGLGFSQSLRSTDVDKLCPLGPRSKDPPPHAGREDVLQHTRSVRRRRQMICVCS